jgi:O-glycosyl hydrolase
MSHPRLTSILLTAILASTVGGTACAAAERIDVDPTATHQTMDGFGASAMRFLERLTGMAEPQRSQVYDLVFRDLGATIMGVMVYPQFKTSAAAAYNWSLMADQIAVVNAARSRGVDTVWAKVSSPPAWMKDNGMTVQGGHLLAARYGDYAAFVATYLAGMRDDHGIPIAHFSIFNEPGAKLPWESTETTPTEYRDVLKVVGARLVADGIPTRHMGTDSPSVTHGSLGAMSGFYVQTLFEDPAARELVSVVATHQYNDLSGGDNWTALRDYAALRGKRVWQSEMSIVSPTASEIDDMLALATLTWRALTIGDASAWHAWGFTWPSDQAPSSQGLVVIGSPTSYTVPKRYYGFKQWAKHVRPGSVRVSCTTTAAGLQVAAFTSATETVVVVVNPTAGDVATTIAVPQAGAPISADRTSATEDHAALPVMTAVGGELQTAIAARSITTFVVPKATSGATSGGTTAGSTTASGTTGGTTAGSTVGGASGDGGSSAGCGLGGAAAMLLAFIAHGIRRRG